MKHKYSLLVFLPVFLLSCQFNHNEKKLSAKLDSLETYTKVQPQRAILYVTAKNTAYRLHLKDTLAFENLPQPDEMFPTIMVDPDKRFQTIEGFGGAFTDATAETFYKLPKEKQDEILNAYFSVEEGIGYSLCRTHINSCDFSSESYAYDEVPGDTALTHFSIEHDKQFRIPLIKAALKINNLKLTPHYIQEVTYENTLQDVETAINNLLGLNQVPRAIIFATNKIGIYALEYLACRGIRIPQDISVISFDDDPSFRLSYPPVTVIEQSLDEIAEHATQLLISNIQSKEVSPEQQIKKTTKLIIRKS